MAATLTGAIYVAAGVPDYADLEPKYVQTTNRLVKAGLYEKAAERWKKFAAAQNPPVNKHDPQFWEKRAFWMRTHYPPESLPNSTSLPSATDSLPPTSRGTQPPSSEPSATDLAIATLPLPSPSQGDFTSTSSAGGSDSPSLEKVSPFEENPPDNSCPMPDLEAGLGLTTEELLIHARWVLHNAMHVKSGRVKIRNAPGTAAAWLLLEVAKNNPKDFFTSVIGALGKIEDKRIAALKEIEAEKKKRFDERRSGDIDVSLLLTELGAAEAERDDGVLQPLEAGRDAAGSEDAEGEHRVSEEAA